MDSEFVSGKIIVKGAFRKEKAWEIISDFENFPSITDTIDSVEIQEKNEKEGISRWSIYMDNVPLGWLEKDYYDKENYKIQFESLECDFEEINGKWKIEDYKNEGIAIYFELAYKLGIPVIEVHLSPVLKKKFGGYTESILNAIKNEIEKNSTEERGHERFHIGKHHKLHINGNSVQATIINVSEGGIMINYDGKLDTLNASIKINGKNIDSEILFSDLKQKIYRIVFKEKISKEEIDRLVKLLSHDTLQVQEAVMIEKDYTTA